MGDLKPLPPRTDLEAGDVLPEYFTLGVKDNFDALASNDAASGASLVKVQTANLPGSGSDVQAVLETQKTLNEQLAATLLADETLFALFKQALASTAVASGASLVGFNSATIAGSGSTAQTVLVALAQALNAHTAVLDTSAAFAPASTAEAVAASDVGKYMNPARTREAMDAFNAMYKVRAAATGAVTIATAFNNGDTLDGVTLATGDLVFAPYQATASENGIYVVGASPARFSGYDSDLEIRQKLVFVQEGTANAGKIFKNTNTSAISVNSTNLTYSDLSILYGGRASNATDFHNHSLQVLSQMTVAASNNLKTTLTDDDAVGYTAYTLYKEIKIYCAGTIRAQFSGKCEGVEHIFGRIYKNGSAVGTEREFTTTSFVEVPTEDFTIAEGDLIQLYARNATTNAVYKGNVKDLKIYYDEVITARTTFVINDN